MGERGELGAAYQRQLPLGKDCVQLQLCWGFFQIPRKGCQVNCYLLWNLENRPASDTQICDSLSNHPSCGKTHTHTHHMEGGAQMKLYGMGRESGIGPSFAWIASNLVTDREERAWKGRGGGWHICIKPWNTCKWNLKMHDLILERTIINVPIINPSMGSYKTTTAIRLYPLTSSNITVSVLLIEV